MSQAYPGDRILTNCLVGQPKKTDFLTFHSRVSSKMTHPPTAKLWVGQVTRPETRYFFYICKWPYYVVITLFMCGIYTLKLCKMWECVITTQENVIIVANEIHKILHKNDTPLFTVYRLYMCLDRSMRCMVRIQIFIDMKGMRW